MANELGRTLVDGVKRQQVCCTISQEAFDKLVRLTHTLSKPYKNNKSALIDKALLDLSENPQP